VYIEALKYKLIINALEIRMIRGVQNTIKQESRAVAGNPRDAAVIFDP